MSQSNVGVVLADRLSIPEDTRALLWDMDGVLLDTLRLDFDIVNDLLRKYVPTHSGVSQAFIRANFAYDPPEFWRRVLEVASVSVPTESFVLLLNEYEGLRRTSTPVIHAGVVEILFEARESGLRTAVVSNNPEHDVRAMLSNASLVEYFDTVIGNDKGGLSKKPAPISFWKPVDN